MVGTVINLSPGEYLLLLTDNTKGWHYSTEWTLPVDTNPTTAEWIIEHPQPFGSPLPQFSTVTFTGSAWEQAGGWSPLGAGQQLIQENLYWVYQLFGITIPYQRARVSGIAPNGTSFTVQWLHY